jgi:pyridoxine kinase
VICRHRQEAKSQPSCHGRRRFLIRLAERHPYLSFFATKGIYHNSQLVRSRVGSVLVHVRALRDIGYGLILIDRVLTDTKIEDGASLRKALTILHETYSVPNVVISSIPMEQWLKDLAPPHIRSPVSNKERSLLCLASVRRTAANGDGGNDDTPSSWPSTVYAACIPLIPGYFSGVGDLFSALVLGHYHTRASAPPLDSNNSDHLNNGNASPPLAHAVSLALTKTHAILRLTESHASKLPPEERTTTDDELDKKDPERLVRRMRGRELRLVQGRKILGGEAASEQRLLREWEDFWRPS